MGRWIAIAVLAAVFLLYLFKNRILVFFPFGLEKIEGEMLVFSQLVSEGRSLYPQLGNTPPFIGCNYPPLYFMLTGFLAKLFSPALVWGRAISFICAILTGVIIFRISRRSGADIAASLIGVLLFYSLPLVNFFSSLHRIHIFSVCLVICGFYLTMPRSDSLGRISISEIAGMVLMALGTLAKQTAVWAPLAYFIWLGTVSRKEAGPAFLRMLLLAVITAFGHIVLLVATRGRYYDWVVYYASGIYRSGRLMLYARWFLTENFVLATPVLLFFVIFFVSWKQTGRWNILLEKGRMFLKSRLHSYFFIYLILVVFSCALAAKEGSSVAYFTEAAALLSCLTAMALGYISRQADGAVENCAVFLFLFLMLIHIGVNRRVISRIYPIDIEFIAARDSAVIRTIRRTGGTLLCEDNIYAFLTKKAPYLVNPFIFSELAKRGIWKPDRIKSDIKSGAVSVVCLNFPAEDPKAALRSLLGKELLDSIKKYFPYRVRIADRYLYMRKKAMPAR